METLTGDNKYLCSECGVKQDASKGCELEELPDVLFFNVNRFVFDLNTFMRVKVNDVFEFPMILDMNPFFGDFAKVKTELTRRHPGFFVEKKSSDNLRNLGKKRKRKRDGKRNDKLEDKFKNIHSKRKGKRFKNMKSSNKTRSFLRNSRKQFKKGFGMGGFGIGGLAMEENFIVEKKENGNSHSSSIKVQNHLLTGNEVIFEDQSEKNKNGSGNEFNPKFDSNLARKDSNTEGREADLKSNNIENFEENEGEKTVKTKTNSGASETRTKTKEDLKSSQVADSPKKSLSPKQNKASIKEKTTNLKKEHTTASKNNKPDSQLILKPEQVKSPKDKVNIEAPKIEQLPKTPKKKIPDERNLLQLQNTEDKTHRTKTLLDGSKLLSTRKKMNEEGTIGESKEAAPPKSRHNQQFKEYIQQGPHVYYLYAVFIHKGTAYQGHYYIYIKSFESGLWYQFDDAQVSEVNIANMLKDSYGGLSSNAGAYILAYRRVNQEIIKKGNQQIEDTKAKEESKKTLEETTSVGDQIYLNGNDAKLSNIGRLSTDFTIPNHHFLDS